ncbi:hypothetical protein HYW59_04165 [Candidatus Kaiserbacteria bacterium]|nr:hypothetical protein [Candidatus Kaiserbacteria bacterium]
MSPQFEDNKLRTQAPRQRRDIHDARWHLSGDETIIDAAAHKEADIGLSAVYRNERQREAYRKVGFEKKGDAFLRMMEKWEKDKDDPTKEQLTEDERDMRAEVYGVFANRMGLAKACEKYLTPVVLKGLKDKSHVVNRLVTELHDEERVLDLIKPRLIKLVETPDGEQDLQELYNALKELHGVHETSGFQEVYGRIERYRSQYNIKPEKWVELQEGGHRATIQDRAFRQLQAQHGFLGKIWHGIPNYIAAQRIGFAGWREDANSQMQRFREMRTGALEILGKVLGSDFQAIIDEEIKTGNKVETTAGLKQKDEQDREFAKGVTKTDIQTRRDTEWAAKVAADPSVNTTAGYDTWVENEFKPAYEREISSRGSGVVMRMLAALFGIRLESIDRPAGI